MMMPFTLEITHDKKDYGYEYRDVKYIPRIGEFVEIFDGKTDKVIFGGRVYDVQWTFDANEDEAAVSVYLKDETD